MIQAGVCLSLDASIYSRKALNITGERCDVLAVLNEDVVISVISVPRLGNRESAKGRKRESV